MKFSQERAMFDVIEFLTIFFELGFFFNFYEKKENLFGKKYIFIQGLVKI